MESGFFEVGEEEGVWAETMTTIQSRRDKRRKRSPERKKDPFTHCLLLLTCEKGRELGRARE